MSAVTQSLPKIPCFGTAKPIYNSYETSFNLNVTQKIMCVGYSILVVGLCAGAMFVATATTVIPTELTFIAIMIPGLRLITILFLKCLDSCKNPYSESSLPNIENMVEGAKELGKAINISPSLEEELKSVIPSIDHLKEDEHIATISYNQNKTATFILKSTPSMQFRIESPSCDYKLPHYYENAAYANQICLRENYTSLIIPAIKPVPLQINGKTRFLLAEQVLPKTDLEGELFETAIRQAVRFFFKTQAGNEFASPVSLFGTSNGKLVLPGLSQLTEKPQPDPDICLFLQTKSIIYEDNSLLASLKTKNHIDIALDEFKKIRPSFWKTYPNMTEEESITLQSKLIEKTKQKRLQKILRESASSHIPEQLQEKPLHNFINVTPEDLPLDLGWADYATVKKVGFHEDGGTRRITLREVTQTILDKINQKLNENPNQPAIKFTKEEMLIGKIGDVEDSYIRDKHYYYHQLQGLGFLSCPNPNKEPPYWINLIFEALKSKGVIDNFEIEHDFHGSNVAAIKLKVNLSN